MPTYNYYCKKCDSNFSYFQNMNDLAYTNCKNCDGEIKRLISGGSGLIFKGSGFYLTDYKSNNKNEKLNNKERKIENKSKKSEDKKIIKKENRSNE